MRVLKPAAYVLTEGLRGSLRIVLIPPPKGGACPKDRQQEPCDNYADTGGLSGPPARW